eukprot:Gb_23865 [translate_table: standard]
MITPLHTLAYALNPRFYHEGILSITSGKAPKKDNKALDGYKKAFKNLFLDSKVMNEFSAFVFSQNSYGDIDAIQDKKVMPPINWWNYYGSTPKHLQTLVVCILSQVASSSSAERN